MSENRVKQSYTIPCSSDFRDSVIKMAENRGVNAADMARSVVLMVPNSNIEAFADPGEPDPSDRETVLLKSGRSKGRPWQRKPRLQIRMATGYSITFLRKALAVALSLADGRSHLHLEAPDHGLQPEAIYAESRKEHQAEVIERLKNAVAVLAFEPVPGGIHTLEDALYVLGFPPLGVPDRAALRTRFRNLASLLHPDSGIGSHQHMSQLNSAMDILRNH